MTRTLAGPLAPFADALPVPQRLVAAEQHGQLRVPIRAGAHRFHRDLPESAIWGYDGTVPGPTIEAERGQAVTVVWRNELDGTLPVVVTTAPTATDASGVPVQCVPGLSGGTPDQNAAALAGHTVVHLHGGLVPAPYDGWAENLFAPGQPNMLTMRELVITGDDHTGPAVTVTDGERTTRYRAAAAHFEDATTFFPVLGRYEVWQLINLTNDTHPIHVHLDPFQILSRRPIRYQIPEHGIEDLSITATVTLERDPGDELGHTIDGNERGLKDTVRVNPNEITEIAVRFTTYSGRYMYHCHILEHEDRDMMRPFVTMPAELMPFMA